jgi:hypothetical protein
MLGIVAHDYAAPGPCPVVLCISSQCLASQSAQGQHFCFHTGHLEMKSAFLGLIRQLLPIWSIYSESHQYSSFFYQLSIFIPKRLKMKFTFSGLIRQLLRTWPIYSESYEYTPFSIKSQ